ncbi:TniQ family protein [Hydrogenophaga intermedia]|nr:TniQ family protein [Hydrogenophaga intermedia]
MSSRNQPDHIPNIRQEVSSSPAALAKVRREISAGIAPDLRGQLLVRSEKGSDECRLGYWHRVAHENGLRETKLLAGKLGIRSSAQLRVCPACLREGSARWPESWTSSFLPICPIHQVWLTDKCTACGSQIKFSSSNLQTCKCGEPFGQAGDAPVDVEVARALHRGDTPHELLIWLGALAHFGLTTKPQKRATVRRVSVQRDLATAGAKIINGWPGSFSVLLDQVRQPPLATGVPQLVIEAFPNLSRMVRDVASDMWRKLVQDAMREFVIASARSINPISTPTDKATELQPSLRMLAQELNVSLRRLSHLIDSMPNGHLCIRRAGKGRRKLVVREEDRQMLKAHLFDKVTIGQAVDLLAIQPRRIAALVASGTLHASGAYISRSSVQELTSMVRARIRKCVASEETVSLSVVFRRWVRARDTGEFLAAICAGELHIHSSEKLPRLGDLNLSVREVRAWRPTERLNRMDWLTIPQAAIALRLKQEVLYGLVNQGLISTQVRDTGRRNSRSISSTELRRFQEHYEPLVSAARRAGVLPRNAHSWALNEHLELVSGPSVDGARQYFVRTQALDDFEP